MPKSEARQEGDPYNVRVIDRKMPGLNGPETTERIRASYGKETVVHEAKGCGGNAGLDWAYAEASGPVA